ncbi:MAG: hypothetical protein ACREDV_10470, partial [Methylocella sp.]
SGAVCVKICKNVMAIRKAIPSELPSLARLIWRAMVAERVWRPIPEVETEPRENFQVGVFDSVTGRLCGCAGLRKTGQPHDTAVLGSELTPDD